MFIFLCFKENEKKIEVLKLKSFYLKHYGVNFIVLVVLIQGYILFVNTI